MEVKVYHEQPKFDVEEMLPYKRVGSFINWSKIFKDKVGLSYPKYVDRSKCIDEEGRFDMRGFIKSRDKKRYGEREQYLKDLQARKRWLELKKEKNEGIEIYDIFSDFKALLDIYKKWYDLGEDSYTVGKTKFVKIIEGLYEDIEEKRYIAEPGDQNVSLIDIALKSIEEAEKREEKHWQEYEQDELDRYNKSLSRFLDDDLNVNVDSILENIKSTLISHEEIFIAMHIGTLQNKGLQKLQEGIIETLDSKIKNLKTVQIFKIMEWVLPFAFEAIDMDYDVPEIFQPKYMQGIGIYSLTLEKFTAQVKEQGKVHGWGEDIQGRLIEQFKFFGQEKEGIIGFGQGSEQLRYWNRVVSAVTPQNYKNYLIDPHTRPKGAPTPRILIGKRPGRGIDNELVKAVIFMLLSIGESAS